MNGKRSKEWSRRTFLCSLSLTPLGCLPNQNKDSNTQTPTPQTPKTEPKSEPPVDNQEITDPDFNPTTPEETCPPPGVIDLSTLKPVPEALTPTMKIYGPAHSALVVIGLERYTHGKLRTIILVRNNGQTLFRREINPADITPEDFIYPILFEGVSLNLEKKDDNLMVMVVRLETSSGDQFYKFHFGEQKVEDVGFGKIPLKTLETLSFQPSQSVHHRHGTFYPQNSTVKNIDENRFNDIIKESNFSQFIPSGIPYTFVVARQDSKYQPSDNLIQVQVTDLLGNPLSLAEPFTDIIRYPMFIVQKTLAGVVYRTLVRVN